MPDTARAYRADELRVGMTAEFERSIEREDLLTFAETSGDFNPLHVDPEYAARTNLAGCIAHGAFQIGLASALAGMHLPGRNVLLGSVTARFLTPLYPPCRVVVRGELTAWNREALGGYLRVQILDAAHRVPYALVGLSVTLHGERAATAESHAAAAASDAAPTVALAQGTRKAVFVTGAGGGLGTALVAALAGQFTVVAMVNRSPLNDSLRCLTNVHEVQASLSGDDWPEALGAALAGRPLYAVVHAAWPGLPRGGLLDCADDAVQQQLAFGTHHVVRLARFLFEHVASDGGRLIVVGSTSGSHRPNLTTAAYSLGKAAMEHTVRLLAPELARKQITVNAVCPLYIPVGMHRQADERQLKLETARVPMGRVCRPDDVAGAVRYLLSPEASFVSSQVLHLSGGQL